MLLLSAVCAFYLRYITKVSTMSKRYQVIPLEWRLLACRESLSSQNVSLLFLFGSFVGGLQSIWLSVSDTGTHTASPSLMS